jgi:hypothetical protein
MRPLRVVRVARWMNSRPPNLSKYSSNESTDPSPAELVAVTWAGRVSAGVPFADGDSTSHQASKTQALSKAV